MSKSTSRFNPIWPTELRQIEQALNLAHGIFHTFYSNTDAYEQCLLKVFCAAHELEESQVVRPLPAVPTFQQWYVDTLVTKEQPIGAAVLKLRDIIGTVEALDMSLDPDRDTAQFFAGKR